MSINNTNKSNKTTICISLDTAKKLEVYCKKHGISRKDYVGLSLDYFDRTGYDLSADRKDFTQFERIEQKCSTTFNVIINELSRVATEMECCNKLIGTHIKENEENVRLKRMLNLALNELNNCKGFFSRANPFILKELGLMP